MEEPTCNCPIEYPIPDYTIVHLRTVNDGRRYMIACRYSLISLARTDICPNCGRFTRGRLISSLHNRDEFSISMPAEYIQLETAPLNFYFPYAEFAARLSFVVVKFYGVMIKYDENTLIYFSQLIMRPPGAAQGNDYAGAPFILVGDALTHVGAFELEESGQLVFINEFGQDLPYYTLTRVGNIFRNEHITVTQEGDTYIRVG